MFHDQKVCVHLHLSMCWEIIILMNFSFCHKEWDAPKFCSHVFSLLGSNFEQNSVLKKSYGVRYSNLKYAYRRKLNRPSCWHENAPTIRKQEIYLHVLLAVVCCQRFEWGILWCFSGFINSQHRLWPGEMSELKLIKWLKNENALPNAEAKCFGFVISHLLFYICALI